MEDIAGGGDGVGAVDELFVGEMSGGDKPHGHGFVAGDASVGAGFDGGFGDLVTNGEDFSGFAEV